MKTQAELGKNGGHARARKMTAEERTVSARQAARARWLRGKTTLNVDAPTMERFCKKWEIDQVEVFGSAARGDMHPKSDVDVIVPCPPRPFHIGKFMEMREDLEAIFGRPIDLLLQDQVRRWTNPILKKQVAGERRVIHVAS